jgi:hypothetical protein
MLLLIVGPYPVVSTIDTLLMRLKLYKKNKKAEGPNTVSIEV